MCTVFCFFSFVPSNASTFNKTQPAEEIKNVNIERDDGTLKSMEPIQFYNKYYGQSKRFIIIYYLL